MGTFCGFGSVGYSDGPPDGELCEELFASRVNMKTPNGAYHEALKVWTFVRAVGAFCTGQERGGKQYRLYWRLRSREWDTRLISADHALRLEFLRGSQQFLEDE